MFAGLTVILHGHIYSTEERGDPGGCRSAARPPADTSQPILSHIGGSTLGPVAVPYAHYYYHNVVVARGPSSVIRVSISKHCLPFNTAKYGHGHVTCRTRSSVTR